ELLLACLLRAFRGLWSRRRLRRSGLLWSWVRLFDAVPFGIRLHHVDDGGTGFGERRGLIGALALRALGDRAVDRLQFVDRLGVAKRAIFEFVHARVRLDLRAR